MTDFTYALLSVVAAGAAGGAVAWGRPDLDAPPVRAALLSAAVASALAAFWLPQGGDVRLLILFAGLAPAAVFDLQTRLIPNQITYPLIVLGLVTAAATGRGSDALIAAAAGFVSFRLLGAAWRRARGIDALGLGDAKLFAAIGAFLGWRVLPDVALTAALAGIVLAIPGALRRGGAAEIPFAPALAFAAAWVALSGPLFG